LKQIDQDEVERADQTLQANLARREHVERLERKGKGKDIGQKAMWVDKYRPTKFTDLLGEEVSVSKLMQTGLICWLSLDYFPHFKLSDATETSSRG
jgi:hypothetical protein